MLASQVFRKKFLFPKVVKVGRFLAFTLAEILIVLSIVGIIAEMTIPTMINSVSNQILTVQFMDSYTILQQASKMVTHDSEDNITNVYPTAQDLADALASKLKVLKSCPNGAANGVCWPQPVDIKTLGGGNFTGNYNDNAPTFMLANGSTIRVYNFWYHQDCSIWPRNLGGRVEGVCADIHLDVNGMKSPNKLGKDIFEMYFFPTSGVLPDGIQGTDDDYVTKNTCNPANNAADSGCGCAGRVLAEHGIYY